MTLTIQNVRLNQPHDEDGVLILLNGRISAILSQLSDLHGGEAGRWFVEFGFGSLSQGSRDFATIAEASAWVLKDASADEDALVSDAIA